MTIKASYEAAKAPVSKAAKKAKAPASKVAKKAKAKASATKKKAVKKAKVVEKSVEKDVAKVVKAAKKAKKDKLPFKRAKTAYIYFGMEKRPEIVAANPNASFGEIGKMVSVAWANLADKSKFVKLSDADKARYAKDKAAHEAGQK